MQAPPRFAPDLLRRWAAEDPDRTALVVDGQGALTYREWDERSDAVAAGVRARGVALGSAVALWFENRDWDTFAVTYMGVLKAGAVAVPLSGRMTDAELSTTLEHCAPVGLIHGRKAATVTFDGWTLPAEDLELETQPRPTVQVRPADLAEVLYTSGTTGRPKGVASTHDHTVRPLIEGTDWYPAEWSASARSVYLHANSIGTAAGQLRLLEPLGPLGMTTVALPTFDAERFCQLIAAHRAAVVQLVPAMALTIMESGAHLRHDVSTVRVVVFGCAPLPPSAVPELAKAFPGARLVNMYELSEARHVGTVATCDDDGVFSASRPRGATEVKIVGPDGRQQSAGMAGEICVRWAGLPPQSYYRDPEATAAVFADGWTRTGDAGVLDHNGGLTLVDRLKDVIISDGLSISSVEVEDVLYQHPAVAEAVVFGLPHRIHGEEVAAAVVFKATDTSPDDLRSFVGQRLAAAKVPRIVFGVDAIPRNRSGKPLKRQLRERFTLPASGESSPGGDLGPIETVRAFWAQVLGAEPGIHDDFFDLGGDSIRASQVAARIWQRYGVRLTVAELFEHRTVAALAAVLSNAGQTEQPAIPRIRRVSRERGVVSG
jgi:acyl-CoA synthetase (AMP-forming)/AMP-acid ligase II/aryl carrier-like protein